MTIYGYARVSAKDQNLSIQLEQLEKRCDVVISEKISGVSKSKKIFEILEEMKSGDVLTVYRLDRLGRNSLEIMQMIEKINEKKCFLIVLSFMETEIDTRSAMGKMFLQLNAVYAEAERNFLMEKQRAGIELAKKNGVYKGRQASYTQAVMDAAIAEYYMREQKNKTVKMICEEFGVSRAALYKQIKMKEEKINLSQT